MMLPKHIGISAKITGNEWMHADKIRCEHMWQLNASRGKRLNTCQPTEGRKHNVGSEMTKQNTPFRQVCEGHGRSGLTSFMQYDC